MPPAPIGGWPNHWYTNGAHTHIACQARGCDVVFGPDDFRQRGTHYRIKSHSADVITRSDHSILLAINSQWKCAHCEYHNQNLQTLLAHEQTQHGTSHMSTVQGYLHLMRQGVAVDRAHTCRDSVYKRLMDNIWNSPDREYRNRL